LEAATFLYEDISAVRGELLRDDMWQYLTCALLPDIVCWRWRQRDEKEPNADRFLGGVRNCLGRLWRRADVFRDERLSDPWTLVRELLEDNVTAILERPRIARHRNVARELARAFLLRRTLAQKLDVGSPEQEYLRQIMLRVRRQAGHVALGALTPDELRSAIATVADTTLMALGGRPRREDMLVAEAPGLAAQAR
jgi:hypothetical protein